MKKNLIEQRYSFWTIFWIKVLKLIAWVIAILIVLGVIFALLVFIKWALAYLLK